MFSSLIRCSVIFSAALAITGLAFAPTAQSQPFTIINGSMVGSVPASVEGWNGTPASGRENGPFQCTLAYQSLNSPFDENASSGSVVITADAAACSLTQQLGITATGQTLTVTADVAWDGNWDYLYFGFYTENDWDRVDGASIDVAALLPPDTDGTLDGFRTVTVTGPLLNNGNPVRVFIGSSCSPWSGGAQSVGTSAFVIDNVHEGPPPSTAVTCFELYQ